MTTDTSPSRDAVRTRLLALWRDLLRRPDLSPGDDFFASGGTSIHMKATLEALRAEFGADIGFDAFLDHPTAEGLAGHVAGRETLTL